jgi:hypothetical protein
LLAPLRARAPGSFFTGRKKGAVDAVASDIVTAGGSAESAEVDALDERAIDRHLQSVIDKAGCVDVAFNAIGIPVRTFWVCLWSN